MESLSKQNDDIKGAEEAKENLDVVTEEVAKICCDKNKRIVEEYLGNQDDAIEAFIQPN